MKNKDFYKIDLIEIGKRLRSEIEKRGFDLKDIAELIQVTGATMSNYVNGKFPVPSDILLNIVNILNQKTPYEQISVEYLLSGQETKDITLHQYKAVTEQALQKIRDMEVPYTESELNKLMKEMNMRPENKKKYLTMMKIIYILIFTPNKDQEFYNYWNMLPGETQDLLLSLDKKIMNNLLKRKDTEGGREKND